jgi:hypothetical protein
MRDGFDLVAKGILTLWDENTGKELLIHKNMVVKNAAHISCIALGGDIISRKIKVATWDTDPKPSYYVMNEMEAVTDNLQETHIIKNFNSLSHTYPATRSIKFTFRIDRENSADLIGENLREWGLYFNDIMFSRIALNQDFIFEEWMNIVGEWTIVIEPHAAGYTDFILNQYRMISLWSMNDAEISSGGVHYMPDMVGNNDLISVLEPPLLTRDVFGEFGIVPEDRIHNDALVTAAHIGDQDNILYIDGQYQNGLDIMNVGNPDPNADHLGPGFTMWCWFKFKEIFDTASTDPYELLIPDNGQWVIFSKWLSTDEVDKCSYKLFMDKSFGVSTSNAIDDRVSLKFKINDSGVNRTLSAPIEIHDTINLINQWNLVLIRFDSFEKKLQMYLNGELVDELDLSANIKTPETDGIVNKTKFVIGSQDHNVDTYDKDTVFQGLIDEVAIVPEVLNIYSIELLWNNGYGNFYAADWVDRVKEKSYIEEGYE